MTLIGDDVTDALNRSRRGGRVGVRVFVAVAVLVAVAVAVVVAVAVAVIVGVAAPPNAIPLSIDRLGSGLAVVSDGKLPDLTGPCGVAGALRIEG